MTAVYKAINAVTKALAASGIGKTRRNEQQGYAFRGIDEVYNALAPQLAAAGLVILPRVAERTVTERQNAKGTVLFYVAIRVEFDFVAVEDGSKHTIATYGEAMDSGDKATNKALSAAYKYAVIQAFAIPVEGTPDADSESHDVAPRTDEESAMLQKLRDASMVSTGELEAAWKSIGKTARLRLADELPALKTAAALADQEAPHAA